MSEIPHRLANAIRAASNLKKDREAGVAYVYLIRCGTHKLYKIGVAENVNERLGLLQVGCPFRLEVVEFAKSRTPYELEEKLHALLEDYRVRGEWFRLNDESKLKMVIDTLQSIPQWSAPELPN